jgi:glycosyltransferase involved in cell wall biosynthesis
MIADQPDEIIVVDYDCPQGAGPWVEKTHPNAQVLYVRDGSSFNVSRARNIGISASRADVLCLIDADILIEPGFVTWIKQRARQRAFFRHGLNNGYRDRETWGTLVCPRKLLFEVGLYDEVFDGWGGEDTDIYYRLKIAGSVESEFPFPLVRAISHGENERMAWYEEKDKRHHLLVNRLYSEVKKILLSTDGRRGDVPISLRQQVRTEIKHRVAALGNRTSIKLQVSGNSWVPKPFQAEKTITIELNISKSEAEPADLGRAMQTSGSDAGPQA